MAGPPRRGSSRPKGGARAKGPGPKGPAKGGSRQGGPRKGGGSSRRSDGRGAGRGNTKRENFEQGRSAGWGKVARRGAATVGERDDESRPGRASRDGRGRWKDAPRDRPPRDVAPGSAAAAWRAAGGKVGQDDQGDETDGIGPRAAREAERRADRKAMRDEAAEAVARGSKGKASTARAGSTGSGKKGRGRPLVKAPGERVPAPSGPATVKGLDRRLEQAGDLFGAERFRDARKVLDGLVEVAPASPEVRELRGVTFYRQGQWKQAAAELEVFRALTHSSEQNPVLADAYRALGRHDEVAALWAELKADSPAPDLMTEGRIVAAGSLADEGDAAGALQLLGDHFTLPKKAKDHHLRRAYALADLHERTGDLPRARELFTWIDRQSPGWGDVAARLRTL